MVNDTLTFAEHMNMDSYKANGSYSTNFHITDVCSFNLFFKPLSRPHLEYGVPVWFPM